MARKGDRAYLEPQAMRLYADGHSLHDIHLLLEVSVTSLAKWKKESKQPGSSLDGWDQARTQKLSNIQRLRNLFDDQLLYMEGLDAADRANSSLWDALSKAGALLERWDKYEKARQVAEEVAGEVKKAGLTEETVSDIRSRILGISG